MKRFGLIVALCSLLLLLAACAVNDGAPTVSREQAKTVESQTAITAQTEASTNHEAETVEAVTDTTWETETIPLEETTAETSTPTETTVSAQAETEAPKPTGSQPTESKPTAPTPTEPKQTEPTPTEPAHVHSYKATVVAPTCAAKGYTEHKCSCGHSYKDSYTDALGHSFAEQTVAATCTSGGYTLRTCSRCGATETANATPALGHDYRDTVVPPTTSSEGYTEHKCSRCGDSYRDNYTEKLHEVFDLQAVIDYGCSYAQSLGFTIDRTMTLENSGYYPGYYGSGYSLDFLKQRVAGNIQYTADMLTADGDTIDGYRCYIHASYEPDTDKYYIVVLYG